MLRVMNFAKSDDVGIFVKLQVHNRGVTVHKGIQHENFSFLRDYYYTIFLLELQEKYSEFIAILLETQFLMRITD